MKPQITMITLGLGLQTTGIIATEFTGDATHSSGATLRFKLQDGIILAQNTDNYTNIF
jgi:hypothetical protein